MPAGEYLVGLCFFAASLGGSMAAALLIVRRRLPALSGTTRFLAWALLATVVLIGVHVVPAALWLLSREAVAAAALVAVFGAALLPRAAAVAPAGFPPPSLSSGAIDRALALVGCAGFGIWILVAAWQLRLHAPEGIDALSFHLPGVAAWVQTGTIWQIDEFLPDLFFGNYPNNGDVVLLATVLPWSNDFLTHFAMFPFVALTAVSTYAVGRELRAPAAPAALLGAMVASIPVVAEPAMRNAMPDPVMFSSFATGLVFLLRHSRTAATSDLVLAGLGLGVAFGTKWYGVSSVALVVGVWAAARLASGVGLRIAFRQTAAVVGLVAAAGGIWLLRNLILSGNPIFPVKVAPFGVTIFDAPPDRLADIVGFRIADYFDQPDIWTEYLDHQYRIAAALPGAVLLLGAAAAAVVLLRRRRGSRPGGAGPALAMLALTVAITAAYVITPYSALGEENLPLVAGANVRYVVPALIAAAGVSGWAAGAIGRRGVLALEVACLVAILDALRVGGVTTDGAVTASFAVAAVAVALGMLLARRAAAWPLRQPRRVAAALALVALIVAVPLGHELQKRFNERRYAGFDPTLDWIRANAPEGNRVGLAGVWTDRGLAPIYPAFGPRLGNEVEYRGPFVRELLRRYHRRGPFVQDLRDADYDLLIVGRSPTFEQAQAGIRGPILPRVKEQVWARSAGYREIVRSDRLVLMRRSD
jgi:hypothetical protein